MEDKKLPGDLTYQEICQSVGKLYLESRYEIQQLTNLIVHLQSQFNLVNNELLSTKDRLAKLQSLSHISEK